jgi:hypothetical protein
MSRYPVYRDQETCERCHRPVDKNKAVWLELDTNTGLYRLPGQIKESNSQGCFAFGPDCAENVLHANGECIYIGLARRNNGSER